MKNIFKNKNVLVTGAAGMIGRELVELLLISDANTFATDIKHHTHFDLRDFELCKELCKDKDYVFLLHGVKGSPRMTNERPADFFVPMIQCNTNMLEACRLAKVKKVLYTSSIAVENMESDKFPANAKLMGEMQIEAYRIQYPKSKTQYTIVRPANCYGRYDNFDNPDAMVITSLIKKTYNSKKKIDVWGDGSAIRDFIHARDVARAMMLVMEKNPQEPINIGSGIGISIKALLGVILFYSTKNLKVNWDTSKPSGAKKRVMNISKLKQLGFEQKTDIVSGLADTIKYYKENYNGK